MSNRGLQPNTIETKLYSTIKQRVNQYFEGTKQSSRGTEFMWFKSAILIVLTTIVYYFAIIQGYWVICPLLGLLMAINGLAIQHDANHGSFSKHDTLNRLAAAVDDVIGGSSLIWRHQHIVLHHVCPNHHELDGDSYSKFPIMRLNPKLPTTWYMRYQWLYGPFLLYVVLLLSNFMSFFTLFP